MPKGYRIFSITPEGLLSVEVSPKLLKQVGANSGKSNPMNQISDAWLVIISKYHRNCAIYSMDIRYVDHNGKVILVSTTSIDH